MSSAQQNPVPGRGKPTVAAAIFVVAFVLSAAMMVWSGWQLYHGEQFPAAVKATGQQCAWVALIDAPSDWAEALETLGKRGADWLPQEATATLAFVVPFAEAMRAPGATTDQPYAICGWGRDVVLAAPQPVPRPDDRRDADAWAAQLVTLAGDPSATALVATPGLLRLAWAPTSHDPAGLLQRAAPSRADGHLGTDVAYRAAVERVGGGVLHLYLPQAAATQVLHALLNVPWLEEGLATVQWLGIGLRRDDDRLRLHAHVAMDQHGAIWLKEVADVAALDDATGWIAADAQAAAIVRMPPALRPKVAAGYGPKSALFARALAQTDAAKAQTVAWQRSPDGAESLVWTADVPALPGLPNALVHGWRVVATTPAMLARTQAVLDGKQPGQGKVADRDRQRLLTQTQGWFDGARQLDWVWTDMGVAVEAAWHL